VRRIFCLLLLLQGGCTELRVVNGHERVLEIWTNCPTDEVRTIVSDPPSPNMFQEHEHCNVSDIQAMPVHCHHRHVHDIDTVQLLVRLAYENAPSCLPRVTEDGKPLLIIAKPERTYRVGGRAVMNYHVDRGR
jgi:hypothetical protein